ncbi:hypothetical protein PanWU01x14_094990 [Parasponia andersonii]|uniref:Uncharacterized protein n=1 Tax=Parasponia andersonii TaxID=3476 RepID=A0A2P5D5N1_PARAD|nr:hypothetical protein PanWU01x14_094990 [Parasponia andersonii]
MSSNNMVANSEPSDQGSPQDHMRRPVVLAIRARTESGSRHYRLLEPSAFEVEYIHNDIIRGVKDSLLKTLGGRLWMECVQEHTEDIIDIFNKIEALLGDIRFTRPQNGSDLMGWPAARLGSPRAGPVEICPGPVRPYSHGRARPNILSPRTGLARPDCQLGLGWSGPPALFYLN